DITYFCGRNHQIIIGLIVYKFFIISIINDASWGMQRHCLFGDLFGTGRPFFCDQLHEDQSEYEDQSDGDEDDQCDIFTTLKIHDLDVALKNKYWIKTNPTSDTIELKATRAKVLHM